VDPPETQIEAGTTFYQKKDTTLVMVAMSKKNGVYKQQIPKDSLFTYAQALQDKYPNGFTRPDAVQLGRDEFSLPDYRPMMVIRWLVTIGVLTEGRRGKDITFNPVDTMATMLAAWNNLPDYNTAKV
jgi:hypothetical protein